MTELLVLDRERWMRGSPPGKSTLLLTNDGKMCCLGFCMAMHGFPAIELLGHGEPMGAAGTLGDLGGCPGYLVKRIDDDECDVDEDGGTVPSFGDTDLTCEAMSINDDSLTTDEKKVELLNEQFPKVGVTVVLVNTPEECEALGGLPANFTSQVTKK